MTIFITIGQGYRDTETGEPDEAISFTSGSEEGWGKRPAMDLARSLSSAQDARFTVVVGWESYYGPPHTAPCLALVSCGPANRSAL